MPSNPNPHNISREYFEEKFQVLVDWPEQNGYPLLAAIARGAQRRGWECHVAGEPLTKAFKDAFETIVMKDRKLRNECEKVAESHQLVLPDGLETWDCVMHACLLIMKEVGIDGLKDLGLLKPYSKPPTPEEVTAAQAENIREDIDEGIRKTLERDIRDLEDREWTDLGGDLEASYNGMRYVDIRVKGSETTRLFISKGAMEKALELFDPEPVAD